MPIRSFLLFVIFLVTNAKGTTCEIKLYPRIVGGQATTIEDHPYQVSVILNGTHSCGGSIISPMHILTAAHCTNGPYSAQDIYVRAGSTIVDEGGQLIQVSKIDQHSSFDSDTYDYDIAILTLSESLTFESGVAAVSLPEQNEGEVSGGLVGTATGWGRLYDYGCWPSELQEVDLPTIDEATCKLIHGDSWTERMFCAGYMQGTKDTCQGDSGGPYVYNGIQIGITSWGVGCGEAQNPGVYTKIQYFRNYIDGIVN